MKHQKTNYNRLKGFLQAVDKSEEGYLKFHSEGYMPLSIEKLWYDHNGKPVFAMAHYGELNGDLMSDPEMELAVDFEKETVTPLTYKQDYLTFYQDVRETPSEQLQNHLDDFLYMWSNNIINQGFKANNILMEV